jgi:hypothetical protein
MGPDAGMIIFAIATTKILHVFCTCPSPACFGKTSRARILSSTTAFGSKITSPKIHVRLERKIDLSFWAHL